MAGLFGAVGSINLSYTNEMPVILKHRGNQNKNFNIRDNVKIGCCSNTIQFDQAHYRHIFLVSDANIDNYADLEKELTDEFDQEINGVSQIILLSYLKWGSEFLDKISGNYAFVLWDDSARILILARDYCGSRPLFYNQVYPDPGALVFASEYKALLSIKKFPANPDLDMLQRLQHFKHLPSDKTLIKEINSVPPGKAMVFDANGRFTYEIQLPTIGLNVQTLSQKQAEKKILDAFSVALEKLVSKRKVFGIALSGGIDSISVAYASRSINSSAEIHTFTAGSGREDPEMKTASLVAKDIDAIHHEIVVSPKTIDDNLPDLVWHLENPIARSESMQFFEIGKIAASFVDFIVTGVAADGLFAGMPKHKLLFLMHTLPFLRNPLAEFYTFTQSGRKPTSFLGQLFTLGYFRGKVPDVPHIVGTQFKPDLMEIPENSKEFLNQVLAQGFQEGVAQWLPKVERTLSASGVAYASPFLDREFIKTAFTIPSKYKIYRWQEKYILRQALKSLVPSKILKIPKFPMRMNYDKDFSDTLDRVANRYLSKERTEKRGFFDFQEILNLRKRDSDQPYSDEWGMRIWTAVLTEIWAEKFLDPRT